jgi:ubiquinone/menaquinone biosynthesis C-methylase UbiE
VSYTLSPRIDCPMCSSSLKDCEVFGERLGFGVGLKVRRGMAKGITVLRCKKCELLFPKEKVNFDPDHFEVAFSGPLPDYGSIPYENSFGEEMKMLEKLSEMPLQEMKALDIGFGFGNSILAMKKRFNEVHGIEPYGRIFRHAIAHPDMREISSRLHQLDLSKAQFEKESFNFIFFEAFQHLADPNEGLKKAMEWLKPGGIIYLELPSSRWLMSKLFNAYYFIRGTKYVCNLSPLHGNFSMYEFSIRTFEINSLMNNYEVIKHIYYPGNTVFKGVVNEFFRKIMTLTNTGMQMAVFLRKKQG